MEEDLQEANLKCSETLRQLPPLGEKHWDAMLGGFWQVHDFTDTGTEGRDKRNLELYTISDRVFQFTPEVMKIVDQIGNRKLWVVELAIVDGNEYLGFTFYMVIDPMAVPSTTSACPV